MGSFEFSKILSCKKVFAINQSFAFQSEATGIIFSAISFFIAAISHVKHPPIDPPIIAYNFEIFNLSRALIKICAISPKFSSTLKSKFSSLNPFPGILIQSTVNLFRSTALFIPTISLHHPYFPDITEFPVNA